MSRLLLSSQLLSPLPPSLTTSLSLLFNLSLARHLPSLRNNTHISLLSLISLTGQVNLWEDRIRHATRFERFFREAHPKLKATVILVPSEDTYSLCLSRPYLFNYILDFFFPLSVVFLFSPFFLFLFSLFFSSQLSPSQARIGDYSLSARSISKEPRNQASYAVYYCLS